MISPHLSIRIFVIGDGASTTIDIDLSKVMVLFTNNTLLVPVPQGLRDVHVDTVISAFAGPGIISSVSNNKNILTLNFNSAPAASPLSVDVNLTLKD